MAPKGPVIDLVIGRDGDSWRLYFAPHSWRPGTLASRADELGTVFPVAQPDLADLERFMWEVDSPFVRKLRSDGGIEVRAEGRAAVTLVIWLEELAQAGGPPRTA